MMGRTVSTAVLLAAYVSAAAISTPRAQGGVASLDVLIPSNRHDDQYYVVNIDFNGQTLPLLLDTGSADTFVASTECNNTNPESGCYLAQEYDLSQPTTILNETFGTVVGFGVVVGNQSIMPVTYGSITVPDIATPLIYYAQTDEFQNGSFSGLFGLTPRNVSRSLYFNGHLPVIDQMITEDLLADPVFSLSFPRLGDVNSTKGTLTLGAVEQRIVDAGITYNEIIDTINWNYDSHPLTPQSWTSVLQGIRVNGVSVNISNSPGLLDDGRYLSLVDSGAQTILVREEQFNDIAAAFNGETIVHPGHDVYFECAVPQVLELMFHDRWFAVDPVDLIIPSDHGVINGTEWCHAALGSWDRDFADSILGVPFLRSVHTVYDYRSKDMYSVQPQVGLASNVNLDAALARYGDLYQKRLL